MIDMRQRSAISEVRKIGINDEYIGDLAAIESDAHQIFSAERSRPHLIFPDQSCSAQPPGPSTNWVGTQENELLRRCQIRAVAWSHTYSPKNVFGRTCIAFAGVASVSPTVGAT